MDLGMSCFFRSACIGLAAAAFSMTASCIRPPSGVPDAVIRAESGDPPRPIRAFELPDGQILTLAQAQEMALDRNPDYRSAFAAVRAAKYRYYGSLSGYLPGVDFTTSAVQTLMGNGAIRNPPPGISSGANEFYAGGAFRMTYLLFDGLEREFGVIAASLEFKRAAKLDENTRRLLLRAVAYCYCDAIRADAETAVHAADLEFQNASLKQVDILYANGKVPLDAVLNFRIQAALADSAMLNSQYRAKAARFALGELLGVCAPSGLALEQLPERILPPSRPLLSFWRDALVNRPDLAAFRFAAETAGWREYAAYGAFLPSIRLFWQYDFSSNAARVYGEDYTRSYYSGNTFVHGAAAEWNLFRGFASVNQLRTRQIETLIAEYGLETALLAAYSEVASAFADVENCFDQVRICRSVLEWVYEQRRLVSVLYLEGKETITRLNGAESTLVETQLRLAAALADLRKAQAALAAATASNLEDGDAHVFGEPSMTGFSDYLESAAKRWLPDPLSK